MKLTSFAVFLVLGLALTGCGGGGGGGDNNDNKSADARSTSSEAVLSSSADCAPYSDFFDELLGLTNDARDEAGLSSLTFSYQLGMSAQTYAEEMAEKDFFSHTGDDGSDFGERITDTGYEFKAIGENLGAGFSTPQTVFDGWMASPSHKANILDDRYTEIGFGYSYNLGSTHDSYWVQHFGNPSDSFKSDETAYTPTTCNSVVADASADQVAVQGVSAAAEDVLPDLTQPDSTPVLGDSASATVQGDHESVPEPGVIAGLGVLTAAGLLGRRQGQKRA